MSPLGMKESFTLLTRNIWKKPKMKRKKKPHQQLQLRPASLTTITIVILSIVTQMTQPIQITGLAHNGGVLALRATAKAEVRVNSIKVVRELDQLSKLDTLKPAVGGRTTSLQHSLRPVQGVPPPPQLHHGRLRQPANERPQQVLRHLLLVLFVPVPRHLLLMLLLLLPLLPRPFGRLHIGERHRRSRDLRDQLERGTAVPRLRHRIWNQRPGGQGGRLLLGPVAATRQRQRQEGSGATPLGRK